MKATLPIILTAILLIGASCVSGLDEDEMADLAILQNINTTGTGGTSAGGTGTTTISIENHSNGTITVHWQNLVWAKCSQVDTAGANMYNAGADDCSSANPGTFQYCDMNNDSCNGGGTPGVLDGNGNSQTFSACKNLTLASRNDWRVPTDQELAVFYFQVFRFNGSLFDSIPSQPEYWSSTSLGSPSGHVVNSNLSGTPARNKTNNNSVRCVTAVQ